MCTRTGRYIAPGFLQVVLLVALTLGGANVEARRSRFRVQASLTLSGKHKPSTLKKRRLVDGGTLLYVGRSSQWRKPHYVHFVDTKTLRPMRRRVPLRAYFAAHPKLLLNNSGYIEDLLFYDRTRQRAGLLIGSVHYPKRYVVVRPRVRQMKLGYVRRYLYVVWDLRADRIVSAQILGTANRQKRSQIVQVAGYLPRTQTGYLLEWHDTKKHVSDASGQRSISIKGRSTLYAVKDGGIRKVVSFAAPRPQPYQGHYPKRSSFLLLEYHELERPSGYIVNYASGAVRRFEIPITAWEAVWSDDGKRIFVGSRKTGYLWSIDAISGKRLRRIRVGKLGGLVRWDKTTLGWCRRRVGLYRMPGLRRVGTRPGRIKGKATKSSARCLKAHLLGDKGPVRGERVIFEWGDKLFLGTYL